VVFLGDELLSWRCPDRINVGFSPLCGLKSGVLRGLRSAKTGREQLQQTARLFEHLVGAGEQRRRHGEAERTPRGERAASGMGGARIESLARTYERPALRKPFAAFPADSKVA
jgi:hypothetical protein